MDISVSKIYTLDQEPNIKEINRYWYDLTNKCLKRYDGSSWAPININTDDVNIVTSSGSQTLSQYLNSQFSTIGDALDSIEASKANIADVVTLSGDQTITGNKIFTPENAVMFNGNGSVYFQTSMVGLNSPEVLLGTEDGITNFAGKMYGDGTTAGNKTETANKVVIENTSAILSSIILGTSEPISAIDTIKLTDSDTHIPSSKLVEDTIAVAISGLETSLNDELENKQDKLLYYSEISGDTPSATISAEHIKLTGSVAEGDSTTASGNFSHAEGSGTKVSGYCSHAEGEGTTVSGSVSHAEGSYTTAEGDSSHAEGSITKASGNFSHAEGETTTASGMASHAEGGYTTASGNFSHAEGETTTASGDYSHAEGTGTTAEGDYSHAEGFITRAKSEYQHVQGKYNIEDAENKYADIIGNGDNSNTYSNAATVSWDGISWSQSDVRAGGTDQDSATHSLSAKQNSTDNSLTTTNKTIVGAVNEINTTLSNKADSNNVLLLDGNSQQITGYDNSFSQLVDFDSGINIGSVGQITYNNSNLVFNDTSGNPNGDYQGVTGTLTTASTNGSQHQLGKIILTSWDASTSMVPSLNDGSPIEVYSKSEIDNTLSAKQNATDNTLQTTDKTVVGAINELRNSIMGAFDPITDVWTATTTSSLTSIISDETYVNAPGRILISPKITNVGAIRVGNNVTDINKAFPLYPDQIVSFTFSNINNFKVAADSVGDGFNYIIEFSVISPYTSQNINGGINVLGSNGSTYSITPKGNAGEETLSINLISE